MSDKSPKSRSSSKQVSEKKSKKKRKEPFARRLRRRVTDTVGLATLLFREPRAFPAEFFARSKRALRTVWEARGGGFYACGFIIAFVWLEITTFFDEVVSADSVSGFVTEQLFEFVLRFTVQSMVNTIQALIWPVQVLEWSPEWGIAFLVGAYLVFGRFIKPVISRWLFRDEIPPEDEHAGE